MMRFEQRKQRASGHCGWKRFLTSVFGVLTFLFVAASSTLAYADLIINFSDSSSGVFIVDSTTAVTLDSFTTTGSSAVKDMAYNQSTGDLFMLTSSGLQKRNSSGVLSTLSTISYPDSSDLAIAPNGNLAINFSDSSSGVFIVDSTTAVTLDSFTTTGSGAVKDLEFDPATGDLFMLTSTGLQMRDDSSGVLSTLAGISYPDGSDLAVSASAVPEASTLLVWSLLTVGAGIGAIRRRRKGKPAARVVA